MIESPSPEEATPRPAAMWVPYAVVLGALLVVGIVTLMSNKGLPEIQNVTVSSSLNDKPARISLPYARDGQPQERLAFDMTLTYAAGQPTAFNVVPDDCLEKFVINGKEISLEGDALKNRCNWSVGFTLELKPFLKEGANSVHVEVTNSSGQTGLRISAAGTD